VTNNGKKYQTADTVSELEGKKINYMLTLLPKGEKIMKTFLIADFFHLSQVSTTPVVYIELRISLRIFEKIRNGPNVLRLREGKGY
jgi:hypothetical protein